MRNLAYYVPEEETLDAEGLARLQERKLRRMLEEVLASNAFYRNKLAGLEAKPLGEFPFTTRQELEADQVAHPPYGTNLTYPLERYTRFHQTSGSGGTPMRWLDTPASWEWVK